MKFENREIPEGINVSKEHPLKEFSQLIIGVVMLVVLGIAILHYSAHYFIRYIPFSFEVEMTKRIHFFQSKDLSELGLKKQVALQKRVDQLSVVMGLPDDFQITVHYSSDDVVNAFATLGGHIFVYQGLIDELNSEQALSAVLAHEIAHIVKRHPITSLGKSVILMTATAVVGGVTGSSAGEALISSSINLSLLTFSREQETQADILAADALQKQYGSIAGVRDLFRTFEQLQNNSTQKIDIFSSHPNPKDRWLTLSEMANEFGWVKEGGLSDVSIVLDDNALNN